jgi:hypothetical protein
MELQFYRCDACKKLDEYRGLIKREKCACGNRRVRPTKINIYRLWLFLLCHPSYFILALWEKK